MEKPCSMLKNVVWKDVLWYSATQEKFTVHWVIELNSIVLIVLNFFVNSFGNFSGLKMKDCMNSHSLGTLS